MQWLSVKFPVRAGRARLRLLGLVLLLLFASKGEGLAQDSFGRDRTWYASVYGTRYIESRLLLIPYKLATLSMPTTSSYLVGGGIGYVLIPELTIPTPFSNVAFKGNSLEIEGQLAKHFGFEDTTEATLALMLRSAQIPLWGGVSFNVALGDGISYAFSDPKYEIGIDRVRGVDTVRAQNFIVAETEFTHESFKWAHFVFRLHHRSGVYGLISKKTGSNYMGGGLRLDLH